MKIERISDNQIRCTLNKEDLAGKETLLNELAFGSDKARGLFRELMNKASSELGFETNDIPLMVEAIPVSKECLILVITRVDNPEDFSEHYKKLSNSISSENIHITDDSDFLNLFGSSQRESMKDLEDSMKFALMDSSLNIYCFSTLEEVAAAARLIQDFSSESDLYKDSMNNCYYLTLSLPPDTSDTEELEQIHEILSEYCKRLPNTYATKALFNEHLKTIIKKNAIKEMAEF